MATSSEHLDVLLEQCRPEELVDLVTSTVGARVEDVGQALGDDLKRQETVWTAAVDKIDDEIRGREEDEEKRSLASRKTNKSVRTNKTKKSKK